MTYTIEELLPLAAALSEKYTSKESTSITYETASRLMEAVIYCIDQSQAVQENKLLNISKMTNAKEDYERGFELILKKTLEAKSLYDEIIENFESYGSRAYYDTVIKGMPAFFINYDARFNPQDHILTLDYPVIYPLDDVYGIDVILRYLECVKIEQRFLRKFSMRYITDVLSAYHSSCQDLFINICSIIIRNMTGSILAGKSIIKYGFTDEELEKIYLLCSDMAIEEAKDMCSSVIKRLIIKEYEGDSRLEEYLIEDMKEFVYELLNAVKHRCLNVIFVL